MQWLVDIVKFLVSSWILVSFGVILIGVVIVLGLLLVDSLKKKPICAIEDCTSKIDPDSINAPCCNRVHFEIWEQQERQKAQQRQKNS